MKITVLTTAFPSITVKFRNRGQNVVFHFLDKTFEVPSRFVVVGWPRVEEIILGGVCVCLL